MSEQQPAYNSRDAKPKRTYKQMNEEEMLTYKPTGSSETGNDQQGMEVVENQMSSSLVHASAEDNPNTAESKLPSGAAEGQHISPQPQQLKAEEGQFMDEEVVSPVEEFQSSYIQHAPEAKAPMTAPESQQIPSESTSSHKAVSQKESVVNTDEEANMGASSDVAHQQQQQMTSSFEERATADHHEAATASSKVGVENTELEHDVIFELATNDAGKSQFFSSHYSLSSGFVDDEPAPNHYTYQQASQDVPHYDQPTPTQPGIAAPQNQPAPTIHATTPAAAILLHAAFQPHPPALPGQNPTTAPFILPLPWPVEIVKSLIENGKLTQALHEHELIQEIDPALCVGSQQSQQPPPAGVHQQGSPGNTSVLLIQPTPWPIDIVMDLIHTGLLPEALHEHELLQDIDPALLVSQQPPQQPANDEDVDAPAGFAGEKDQF